MRSLGAFGCALLVLGGCGAGATVPRRPEAPTPATAASASPLAEAERRHEERATSSDEASLLATAMERRMTIWTRPDGTSVFPAHCRDAPGGCRARLRLFAEMFTASAERHGLDPFLLAGLAMRESSFNPAAEGGVGEVGIVQLHPQGEGRDVRFVQDARYRRRCLERTDACQREVVERAASFLARSAESCGSLTRALGRYATGSCERGLTHALRVVDERDRLREALREPPAQVASAAR